MTLTYASEQSQRMTSYTSRILHISILKRAMDFSHIRARVSKIPRGKYGDSPVCNLLSKIFFEPLLRWD